jgi:predicted nucleic acid-binding protein
MNELTFVDADILVYARDSGQAQKQTTAIGCLQRLWREHTGRTSVQALSEYYVTLTRKLKPGLDADDAWDDVQALMSWEPQAIDGELLKLARDIERRFHTSWWDAMIVAAAEMQSCTLLLSEDFQHGMVFGQVRVHDPFLARVGDIAGEYQVPIARARHRHRGRPLARGPAAPI